MSRTGEIHLSVITQRLRPGGGGGAAEAPDVAAVSVIGVPDRDWGERVVAVVVPAKGSTAQAGDLIAHCGRHLASYKKPKQVHFVESTACR